jgi:meso-butanediol dehydrogenase / (S,S)-butanediol dehydrogenase / diacetyl reductase
MSRSVLVVGASSPIGRAIGAAFAATGDRVVGVALEPFADPSYVDTLVLDCSTAAGAQAAVDAVAPVDVVVLAAAAMPVGPVTSTTDGQWRAALDATLGTAFAICRAVLPTMGDGGAIVAVSSVNAFLAAPGVPAYAAAKAGLEGLVRQLALEYGPRGVRVNAVAPGMIGAPVDDASAGYPLGRTGRPEEVAAAVHFLAGAGFVTGVVLPVDGGLSIASPAAFLRADLRERWLP